MYVRQFMGIIGITAMPIIPNLSMERNATGYGDVALGILRTLCFTVFRAWEKYRFPVGYERGADDFTAFLFDFVGLGTSGLRGRMDLEDESLLPYGGLIAQKPHSAIALGNILSDYFGVTAKIEQFFGQWLG